MMNTQPNQDSTALRVDQSLRQAVAHYQGGQLQDAESLLRDILQVQPQHPDANHNLGTLMVQSNQIEASFPYFEAALNTTPISEQFWSSYIDALIQANLIDAARQALVTSQKFGVKGESIESLSLMLSEVVSQKVIPSPDATRPSPSTLHSKASKANKVTKKLKGNGRGKLNSNIVNSVMDLLQRGLFSEAEVASRELVVNYPENNFAWKVLGIALKKQGYNEESMVSMQRAVEVLPGDAESHYNLGHIFKDLERLDEAEASFRQAIKIKPRYAEAHSDLGSTLKELNRPHEAETSYRKAVQILPKYAKGHYNLATHLSNLGRIDEAILIFKRAVELTTDDAIPYNSLLFHLSHSDKLSSQELFAWHCHFGEKFEEPLRTSWSQHLNLRDPDKCLKIGFVSGDFYNHAVASFIEPILMHLSGHPQLSLYAYSDPAREDAVTNRLRGYFNQWYSMTGLADANLADKIRADGIDILIDLSGHTARNRLLTFARKPAPVQLSWIGYPGTTGLQAMDYYLADPFFLPPGKFDDQFIEKIVYLPATAPFSPHELSPPVNTLPALNNGYVTFGSFNRPAKINSSVIALWSELMRAVPKSRMLLGAMQKDGENETLVELFAKEGITSERLAFHSRTSIENYLSLHHQVDICLDTFPYNGGTTTHNALWMGVPTLTLTGHTVPSRTGAAILSNITGLESFVVGDKIDFVQQGVFWAENLGELADLRGKLRGFVRQSPQGQPKVIADGLKLALRAMWKCWCAGLPAESFEVSKRDVDDIIQANELKVEESKKQMVPIYVTQPLLPPLEEFIPYLQEIWDSKQLTNGGPFHQQLEQELCEYLGVKYISLFSNGTLALMTAMQSLRITGEVITTPYSFVATAHSLLWNGIKPVFVDIDPITLNLDPRKIEAAITPQTTAIMPVHCYGHPCDVKSIQKIADNYGLKVIYDAAHAFGVECPDGSILNHGDLSVLSFHATKVFNTFEGGAIVCHDAKTKQRIDQLKNFGFVDEVTVVAAGINGKMSEVNAAFGLLQLKRIDEVLEIRKSIDVYYREKLFGMRGIQCLSESGEKVANYAYFPILVTPDYLLSRDELYQKLRENGIYARRYFYPLVSDFPMYRGFPSAAYSNLPNAKKISNQVICLPIYPDLLLEQVDFIANVISGQ
jgi:dTDP-4-amino-4,6-dideoxygalactose transaminase/predicted O-linked N-acetylglucosamine transferase (SPINDLY family)